MLSTANDEINVPRYVRTPYLVPVLATPNRRYFVPHHQTARGSNPLSLRLVGVRPIANYWPKYRGGILAN
jgi:hypothetical protein